ncbi:hypothetical protein B0H13DRAFT_1970051 [Mycena leptocephala]|nr:hypothetical protein B0H13DRAFT_1970051 [Mycena leptocephala]
MLQPNLSRTLAWCLVNPRPCFCTASVSHAFFPELCIWIYILPAPVLRFVLRIPSFVLAHPFSSCLSALVFIFFVPS